MKESYEFPRKEGEWKMKEHMRKSWKNMIVYGMALCFLLITVVIPRQAVLAKDSGDGWGSNQIVEFKGKNATWNLCADQVYNIKTGNRSNVWKKVTLKSSNKAVVKAMNCYGSKGNWYLGFTTGVKPGKATLTMTVKDKKKTYNYKFKIVTKKHDNPFKKLKIDSNEIQKQFNIQNDYKYYTEAEVFLKPGNHVLSVKTKKNWKLVSIILDMWDHENNITKTKKFTIPMEGDAVVTVQNEKTGENRRYRIALNEKR